MVKDSVLGTTRITKTFGRDEEGVLTSDIKSFIRNRKRDKLLFKKINQKLEVRSKHSAVCL